MELNNQITSASGFGSWFYNPDISNTVKLQLWPNRFEDIQHVLGFMRSVASKLNGSIFTEICKRTSIHGQEIVKVCVLYYAIFNLALQYFKNSR